jgi:CubicO group peptidase (beta-lactamase class C family)
VWGPGISVTDNTIDVAVKRLRKKLGTRGDGIVTVKGLGFMLPPTLPPRVGPRAFGHGGNGGSFAFADPDRNISFGYVLNRVRPPGESEVCQYALVEALYDSLR